VSVLGPRIIEDDECDVCPEPALPYDDFTDLPYCAKHKQEMYTNIALEDFTHPAPRVLLQIELDKLTRRLSDDAASQATICSGSGCLNHGMSRLSPYDYMSVTMDTCVGCAQEYWTAPYMPDEEWLQDLAMDVDIEDELPL
jgi:hypothetical protein